MRELDSDRRRLAAITEFGASVSLERWSLVENDLLQREFAWPLVVIEHDGQTIECALPILVDVNLDPTTDGPAVSLIQGNGLVNCAEWIKPAVKAMKAAKSLWLYKHTSWDKKFVSKIAKSKAIIDVRVSEMIVEPYKNWFQFQLTDDSLGAYLSVIMFSRFSNHGAADTICATGTLGAERPDPTGDGGDWRINSVDWIDKKIEYAEKAFFFEQIIVPGDQSTPTIYRPHLRVNRGNKLSDYVEHVVGQSWRKHRYVRAADLSVEFKRYKKGLNGRGDSASAEDQAQIDLVCESLRASTDAIVELGDEITPENVVAALYEIASRSADGGHDNQNLANYTLIRTVEGEGHERFWRVVWEAIDGNDRNRTNSACERKQAHLSGFVGASATTSTRSNSSAFCFSNKLHQGDGA